MKKKELSHCPDEDFMDSYLLGRISPESMANFEKHYFDCTCCFHRVAERDEVIKLLKNQDVFGEPAERAEDGAPRGRGLMSRPFWRWTILLAAAGLIALVVWLLVR